MAINAIAKSITKNKLILTINAGQSHNGKVISHQDQFIVFVIFNINSTINRTPNKLTLPFIILFPIIILNL